MKKRLCVVYVSGLGGDISGAQQFALRQWRYAGAEVKFFAPQWSSNEPWAVKAERLLNCIDECLRMYDAVAIVGVSAGAAPALWAYAQRRSELLGCAVIAGKVNRPETIGANYRRNNPMLLAAVQACVVALAELTAADRRRVLSMYGLHDSVVDRADSIVPGARNCSLWAWGHMATIATALTIGAPYIIRFLRSRSI